MIDFGFDKLALIGAVALIVIGPEKLPRVARTVGALMGKARRYVADVKAEVNRTIELEELQKVRTQFETAARDVHDSLDKGLNEARDEFDGTRRELGSIAAGDGSQGAAEAAAIESGWREPPPSYRHPGKRWRLKRGALPRWYKHRAGVRTHVQSAAARVARHRPADAAPGGPKRLG